MKRYCDVHKFEWEDPVIKLGFKEYHFKVEMCPKCVDDLEEQKKIEDEKKQCEFESEQQKKEQEKLEEDKREWILSNIEKSYHCITLFDIKSRSTAQDSALRAIKKMITEEQGMIFMLGNNGTGKTMLSKLAQKEFMGVYRTMYEISAEIRSTYIRGDISELDIVGWLSRANFLVIDEIGKSKASESELNWLNFIMDKRWANKLPTIMISNKHLEENCKSNGCLDCLENYLTDAIIDRLTEGYLINFDGESQRGK